MSERKVLNKYYPPDFDASKIPKLKLPRDRQYVVRLMAPFNMRCTTCGEYIYKGKKFNARKETVQNETYLGLLIFRFYIRCPKCISEITFKTDPENTDYVCENGATRNFQASRLLEQQVEQEKKEREEEEVNNPMKALENRTKESKQEMDILEKLEELKDLNARHAQVDYEALLMKNKQLEEQIKAREEAEDEELVRSVFGSNKIQRRIVDDENDDEVDNETAVSLNRTGNEKRPTDILTEDARVSEELSVKKVKTSWETGVGKLNSKPLLSTLVRVKKSNDGKPRNSTTTTDSSPKTISVDKQKISPDGDSDSSAMRSDSQPPGGSSLALLGDYSSSEGDSE